RPRRAWRPVPPAPRMVPARGGPVFGPPPGLRPGDEVAARGAFLIDSQAQLAGNPSLLFPAGLPASGTGTAR
ncbi:MAG: hypothetical protein ACKOUK_05210, partial [Verrucomicrobiota bacterium]